MKEIFHFRELLLEETFQIITDGVVDGNFQILQLLETHFDRALAVCEHARMIDFEPMTRLLNAAAAQMVENSIWTVTRAVNSKVTQFVRRLLINVNYFLKCLNCFLKIYQLIFRGI